METKYVRNKFVNERVNEEITVNMHTNVCNPISPDIWKDNTSLFF